MKKHFAIAALILGATQLFADIQLPRIFSDNILLQREKPVKIWGTADANAKIDVEFAGTKKSATADARGKWSLALSPLEASTTPREMKFYENGKLSKTVANVLVGEVWILGGQSNMEMTYSWRKINPKPNGKIRYFKNPIALAEKPADDTSPNSRWVAADKNNLHAFSMIGYGFAQYIAEKLDIPVGLVYTARGGAKMETYIPFEAMDASQYLKSRRENYAKSLDAWRNGGYQKAKKKYDLRTDDGRLEYIREAIGLLADSHVSPTARDVYAGRIAGETGVSKQAVVSQLEGALKGAERRGRRAQQKEMNQQSIAAGIRVGQTSKKDWSGSARNFDVFDVKADALAAIAAAKGPYENPQITRDAPAYYHPGRSGALRLGKNVLAYFGELHPAVAKKLGLKERVVAFEVYLDNIPLPRDTHDKSKKKLELSPFQPVDKDLAFIVGKDVAAANILAAAKNADREHISDVRIFDIYEGSNLPENKKSVALSVTFQPKEQTFTDKDIENLMNKVIVEVGKKTGGELRN